MAPGVTDVEGACMCGTVDGSGQQTASAHSCMYSDGSLRHGWVGGHPNRALPQRPNLNTFAETPWSVDYGHSRFAVQIHPHDQQPSRCVRARVWCPPQASPAYCKQVRFGRSCDPGPPGPPHQQHRAGPALLPHRHPDSPGPGASDGMG
ncbi:hypothetical protein PAPYR_12398 [Paratrimastix pyriformis]|uniref:Uncharacterized protein n=1 Tax=Paratrimastix pyriformis TaxID=342808 RepID=A0ABQ8U1X8_9EUKA|nr:hypothetical protein PAPYR_12398 [Paratrimastix pyriformis]